jgi:hypothetical protein
MAASDVLCQDENLLEKSAISRYETGSYFSPACLSMEFAVFGSRSFPLCIGTVTLPGFVG